MDKPRIFLGSSGMQEKLLQALTRGLEDVAHLDPWTKRDLSNRPSCLEFRQSIGEHAERNQSTRVVQPAAAPRAREKSSLDAPRLRLMEFFASWLRYFGSVNRSVKRVSWQLETNRDRS